MAGDEPNLEIQFDIFAYINFACYMFYASGPSSLHTKATSTLMAKHR